MPIERLPSGVASLPVSRKTDERTFCWRQSLQALFTPGWCRGLEGESSPLAAPRELRLRLRPETSSSGEAPLTDCWAGDCSALPPGGSKEVPALHDICSAAALLVSLKWMPVSEVGNA